MTYEQLIQWLLEGDISIRYQVYRDLLEEDREDLQHRITQEGWGAKFLDVRRENGHWGLSFYQPKWASTHYTLLDLRNLCMHPETQLIRDSVQLILREERGKDGGIHPARSSGYSDVCINGMFLYYGCYFGAREEELKPVVDYMLLQRMKDGGFNCRLNRSGARHSSLHSTLCVCEGIRQYRLSGFNYRMPEMVDAEHSASEFILQHSLYLSDRTGEIIHPGFLKLAYPGRWRYDILRALDYFRFAGFSYDLRMEPALEQIHKKRRSDGTWSCSRFQGAVHLHMEEGRRPSRWNTLRALRVLKHFDRI